MTNKELDELLGTLRKHGATSAVLKTDGLSAHIEVTFGPQEPEPARVNIARGEDGVLTHTDIERNAEAEKLMYPE